MAEPQTTDAIRTVEAAIRDHHVLELTYVTKAGITQQLTVEPLAIRNNTTHHVVLWAHDLDAGHVEQLWLSGIVAAHDTGRGFAPEVWTPASEA